MLEVSDRRCFIKENKTIFSDKNSHRDEFRREPESSAFLTWRIRFFASFLLSLFIDLTSVVASTDSSTTALVVQQELKTAFEKLTPGSNSNVQIEPSIQDAIESITSSNDREIHVLVAGSLHLVGGVMAHLKDWGWLDESLKSMRE